jgi:hypothetical protein
LHYAGERAIGAPVPLLPSICHHRYFFYGASTSTASHRISALRLDALFGTLAATSIVPLTSKLPRSRLPHHRASSASASYPAAVGPAAAPCSCAAPAALGGCSVKREEVMWSVVRAVVFRPSYPATALLPAAASRSACDEAKRGRDGEAIRHIDIEAHDAFPPPTTCRARRLRSRLGDPVAAPNPHLVDLPALEIPVLHRWQLLAAPVRGVHAASLLQEVYGGVFRAARLTCPRSNPIR